MSAWTHEPRSQAAAVSALATPMDLRGYARPIKHKGDREHEKTRGPALRRRQVDSSTSRRSQTTVIHKAALDLPYTA